MKNLDTRKRRAVPKAPPKTTYKAWEATIMSNQTIDLIYNITGIIGVGIIIITYFLLQLERINPKALPYSVWNLIGAILIITSLFRFWNLASFIIEVFWIAISLYGIYKAIKNRKKY